MRYLYTYQAQHKVANLEEAIETFGRNFGLWPRAGWPVADFPPEGWKMVFCPVGDLATAPTFFSLLQPTSFDEWIGRAWLEQAPRPYRYHCFAVVVDDLDFLIAHIRRLGITYLISENLSWLKGRRLFIGRSPEDPLSYDPSFDAAVRFEVLPLAEHTFLDPPPPPSVPPGDLPPGAFIRVESTSTLVDDIYEAIQLVGSNLLLWPAPGSYVQDDATEGVKRISVPIGVPQSTKLEIISPYDFNKPIGKWFKQYGKGQYHHRFSVTDLDTRLRELESRGVGFDVRGPDEVMNYRRAWIDPAYTLGANLEFVDYRT
ncbi:hypothetical protein ACFLTS_06745 [Chloroflexota bacterium]